MSECAAELVSVYSLSEYACVACLYWGGGRGREEKKREEKKRRDEKRGLTLTCLYIYVIAEIQKSEGDRRSEDDHESYRDDDRVVERRVVISCSIHCRPPRMWIQLYPSSPFENSYQCKICCLKKAST